MYNPYYKTKHAKPTKAQAAFSAEIKERDRTLIRLCQRHDDKRAETELLTLYKPLMLKRAYGWHRKYPHCSIDILRAAAEDGFMRAIKKFDFDFDVQLATYAEQWMKSKIQDAILKNYPNRPLSSDASFKAAYFGMPRVRKILEDKDLSFEEKCIKASEVLKITPRAFRKVYDIVNTQYVPLDAPLSNDNIGSGRYADVIADITPNAEDMLIEQDIHDKRRAFLQNAMDILNPREQAIVKARHLKDEPDTLGVLSEQWGISRERVRQIEEKALGKLTQRVRSNARKLGLV